MEISRLTFSRDTKDKLEKGLTKKQRGELRFNRLKEAEANGSLQKAKNRIEVAHLVGYTDEQYKTGYSWVCNMLARKHLIERIGGLGANGKVEYEYTIGSEPDYRMVNVAVGRRKANETRREIAKKYSQESHKQEDATEKTTNTPTKITITYGDLKIELSDMQPDMVKDVITSIFDKVKGE